MMEVDGIASSRSGVDTVRAMFDLISDHDCVQDFGECVSFWASDSAAIMYCSRPPLTEKEERGWLDYGSLPFSWD